MARHPKKHKKRQRQRNTREGTSDRPTRVSDATTSINGYDFGIPTRSMVVAALEFTRHLHEATARAVAYGLAPCPELREHIPCVTLVVEHEAPITAAFAEFERWGSREDGDVVEVGFVFRENSEYVFTLGPEIQRLLDRSSGYSRLHEPISMAGTWLFPIPLHAQSQVRAFCESIDGTVRPYLFSAAVLEKSDTIVLDELTRIRPLSNIAPILKFERTVIHAGDKASTPGSLSALAVGQHGRRRRPFFGTDAPPPQTPVEISEHRKKMLETYFPVTLERLRVFGLSPSTQDHLASRALRPWQVQQAICNIVLSRRVQNGRAHYPDFRSTVDLTNAITRALDDTVEEVDGNYRALHDIPMIQIVTQVEADVRALLRERGHPFRRADLAALQNTLLARGLLGHD